MSADISGFTRLSERLAGAGRLGAEVLSDAIDAAFTALIDCVLPNNGDVLFFGGDALFVAFTGSGHARRAVDSAAAMQHVLRRTGRVTTPAGTVRLTMSVGVASGTAQVVVGDGPQRPLFVVGPTVTRSVELEARATAGQVLVAAGTSRRLASSRRGDRAGAARADSIPTADPAVERHLPDALRARLLAGDAPREHRHVAVAFVHLRGLDRMAPAARAARLLDASALIGTACAELDVCWVSTDVFPGGAKAILAAGVPLQSDDDELRLVAAAKRVMAGDLGRHLTIGVHRGTAFVGDIGHPSRRTYTVMGDTVNTAARLTGRATPNSVLASVAVADRLGGRYRLGPAQELFVKGKRTAVPARTIGAATASRDHGAAFELVGRSDELRVLHNALAGRAEGRGAAVDVVGPTGIGKSRLIEAFLAEGPVPAVAVAGELALSVVPFGALAAPLRALLELGADPSQAATRLTAIAGALAPLVGPAAGIDLPATPESAAIELRSVPQQRLDLIARLVLAARPEPGLLLVEDVHWLDPASAVLLGELAERLVRVGWLAISTRRPETAPLTPGTSLVLEPLGDADVRRLAIHASADRDLTDAALQAVVERADGNPLFLRQLVETAVTGGDIGLPESAERVVGARIDVLPAAVRRRVRQASVLGSEVDLELLVAVTRDAELRAAVAWEELDEFVAVDDGRLRFRHDLFRLAAYEGLSFADRTVLHRAAAAQLERRRDTPAAVLAQHFERGRRPDRATVWATRAAREATSQAAFTDAVRLWRSAVDCAQAAGRSAGDRAALLVQLGMGYELLAELTEAEQTFREALALAAPGDRPAIRLRLAWVAFRDDRTSVAKRRVTIALRELDSSTPSRKVLATRIELALLRAAIREFEGDRRGSDEDAQWAEVAARRVRRPDLRAEALMQLALNADSADDAEIEQLTSSARTRLERSGKVNELGILDLNLGITHMVRGRWPRALTAFESASASFARCGGVLGAFVTDVNRGGILVEQGRLREAIDLYDDVVRRARAVDHSRTIHFGSGSAARARAWLGDVEAAITTLGASGAALRETGHRHAAGYLRWYLAEALLLAGHFPEAREITRSLLDEFADMARGESVEVALHRLDAETAYLMGDRAALTDIEASVELARMGGATYEIVRGLHSLEVLSPVTEPAWAEERARLSVDLGVVWLPPITFAVTG